MGAVKKARTKAKLALARQMWRQGSWETLSSLPIKLPLKPHPKRRKIELTCYVAQACFLVGKFDYGLALINALRAADIDQDELLSTLLSGALTNIGRAWLHIGKTEEATYNFEAATALFPKFEDPRLISLLRRAQQGQAQNTLGRSKSHGLFIDCGGGDGSFALSFLSVNPSFDSVSFEPTPDFWPHYENLPTTLIGKAAYLYNGDMLPAAASPKRKPLIGKKNRKNGVTAGTRQSEKAVPCIDIPAFVQDAVACYENVVLKLDTGGTEYRILEKLISDGSFGCLNHVYCRFNSDSDHIEHAHQDKIVKALEEFRPIQNWNDISLVPNPDDSKPLRIANRDELIEMIAHHRKTLAETT